jgi:hypothetical protein
MRNIARASLIVDVAQPYFCCAGAARSNLDRPKAEMPGGSLGAKSVDSWVLQPLPDKGR